MWRCNDPIKHLQDPFKDKKKSWSYSGMMIKGWKFKNKNQNNWKWKKLKWIYNLI